MFLGFEVHLIITHSFTGALCHVLDQVIIILELLEPFSFGFGFKRVIIQRSGDLRVIA